MKRFHSIKMLGVICAAMISLNGCFSDSSVAPTPSADEAPVLPSAERLQFKLDFFQEPSVAERSSNQNFFNAYIRVVIVSAITHLMLTPPIEAFALALHTPPSPQDDGSYIWVYTFVDGDEEAQIRLRGEAISGTRVRWELRVSSTEENPPIVQALWFEGETGEDGDNGFFRFYELDDETLAVGRIDWGNDTDGDYLRFTDLNENIDDSIEFRALNNDRSLVYTDASDSELSWFVKWDEVLGSGSLRAPDFNDGEEACWDERQRDTACTPAL